ncbi:MAG: hypothetical protein Hals2KO_01370 [Halioglobus sp.]
MTYTYKDSMDAGVEKEVDSDNIAAAILSIKGREPTFEDLAEQLRVEKVALLEHVTSFDHLATLAGDAILDALSLPDKQRHAHWAQWSFHYAMTIRDLISEYPIFLRQLRPRAAQVMHVERVLDNLVDLGLSNSEAMYTQFTMFSMGIGAASSKPFGMLLRDNHQVLSDFMIAVQENLESAPRLAALLHGEQQLANIDDDMLVSTLIQFALEGIARRRDEALPSGLDFNYQRQTLVAI